MFAVDAAGELDGPPTVMITYDESTGQLHVETAASSLTALQISSTQNLLIGGNAVNLGGPFDIDRPDKLFVMKLDGFQSLDLGPVLPAELSLQSLRNDLHIEGAWLGGGAVEAGSIESGARACQLGPVRLGGPPALASPNS